MPSAQPAQAPDPNPIREYVGAAANGPSANGAGPLTGAAAGQSAASSAPSASPAPTSAAASSSAEDGSAPKSGLQRAIQAVRTALPIIQRLLPLLDGNFATAIGALMAPQPAHSAPAPPPVQVDFQPVERALEEVRNSHRELRGQVLDQVTTLKRVEDHLERVREATDRNTLEQQELVEDMRSMGSRVNLIAVVGLLLLAGSIALNVFLLVKLQQIFR